MTTAFAFGSFLLQNPPNYYVVSRPFEMPPFKQSLSKIARLDGVKKSGSIVNERSLPVKLKVIGSSRTDLEAKLEALYTALQLQQQQLLLNATDGRYFVADCIAASCTFQAGSPISADVALTFTAQQPYALNPTTSTYDTGVITAASSSGICTFATQSFAGGGSVRSLPTITITQQGGTAFAWTSLTINEVSDNRSITITNSLPATNGDAITIYCDPTLPTNGYTVQLNNSGVPIDFNGVFPYQQYGSTSWQIVVGIGGSGTVSLDANWTWTPLWWS